MNDLTRRHAFQAMAVGAAAAMSARPAEASTPSAEAEAVEAARQATLREASTADRGRAQAEARVHLCRSWDREVYLYAGESRKGFATLDEAGFALAVACQAAGRPVAFSYLAHQPAWNGGVGRFEGVRLALEMRDLPGTSPQL